MKTLENENEKVNRICEILKNDALEPARKQAQAITEEALRKADEIIQDAEKEAVIILENSRRMNAQERTVFQASLSLGAKQGLEVLRHEVEKLFNSKLEALIADQTAKPEIIAEIITVLINAVRTQGSLSSLKAFIPKQIAPSDVIHLLLMEVLKQLEAQSVEIGDFKGGAQLKLINKNMRLDMTDEALKELIGQFIREDLRKYLFNE